MPPSAKQQCEMTKFCVVYGTWTANLSYFHLELNAVIAYLAWAHLLEPLAYWTDLDNREFSL